MPDLFQPALQTVKAYAGFFGDFQCLCLFLVILRFKDHQIHHSPYQKDYNSKSRQEYDTYLFSVICSVLQSENPTIRFHTVYGSSCGVMLIYSFLFCLIGIEITIFIVIPIHTIVVSIRCKFVSFIRTV